RNNSITLALLTGQESDAPDRQAEALYKANLDQPGAVVTYALSLYLQDRADEALKLFAGFTPEQLREPRTALYYGIFLAAAGDPVKAADYLRIGLGAPIFPEERALVEKVATEGSLKSLVNQHAQK
ncbi:MAG TPA: hypothetical protein VEO95_12465, partial [Chthoniobacteraceae bacterium]|nr:hypothetical protein [Chthoniobacteraceae bacterium]